MLFPFAWGEWTLHDQVLSVPGVKLAACTSPVATSITVTVKVLLQRDRQHAKKSILTALLPFEERQPIEPIEGACTGWASSRMSAHTVIEQALRTGPYH